ncbi:YTH domain-containing protein ECT3 isoform X2 [Humulus lupulus]|uniref:YTH domain-containing protein ECT3 isoform X2 n=1 Tax=Humulus lupulus TaxID=3486 RepID=UPI002B4088D7|nr:YTH domain-containing protein ECT3 isoform X2 [Humulus lupulus]
MAGEKKIENAEPVAPVLISDPVTGMPEQEVASGKDGVPSELTSSISSSKDVTSSIKGEIDQQSVGEHGVYNPPSSCDNYYYPGYNGSFTQLDDQGYYHANGSNTAIPSENGLYYNYYYNPYQSGPMMGVDGQGIGQQQYFSSSGYHQPPVSYGSEALSCYSWDPAYGRDVPNGTKSGLRSTGGVARSNGYNSAKSNGSITNKFSKPLLNTQPIKSLTKVGLGSDFSAGLLKGYPPHSGRYASFANQKQGLYPQHAGFTNYKPYGTKIWPGNDRFKSRDKNNRNGDFEASTELTRGPRSRVKSQSDSSPEKEELGSAVQREQYNTLDFPTDYEYAKFYVIKSYSEDDVHKSIKYDVWASTPNGNKKLDAAFHDAEVKSSETGTRYPIFLFFSVNGSGQFVGVAEMAGQVDFNKDMDFWQVDKWNGFFPVKWHIVKDIPNTQLRHIILENNDNKPVTFTRDTQEIGLKQGLEMLNIFKSYTPKTTLLDDFSFYESREQALQAKRAIKPAATLKVETNFNNSDFTRGNAVERNVEIENSERAASLISLANLSLSANA